MELLLALAGATLLAFAAAGLSSVPLAGRAIRVVVTNGPAMSAPGSDGQSAAERARRVVQAIRDAALDRDRVEVSEEPTLAEAITTARAGEAGARIVVSDRCRRPSSDVLSSRWGPARDERGIVRHGPVTTEAGGGASREREERRSERREVVIGVRDDSWSTVRPTPGRDRDRERPSDPPPAVIRVRLSGRAASPRRRRASRQEAAARRVRSAAPGYPTAISTPSGSRCPRPRRTGRCHAGPRPGSVLPSRLRRGLAPSCAASRPARAAGVRRTTDAPAVPAEATLGHDSIRAGPTSSTRPRRLRAGPGRCSGRRGGSLSRSTRCFDLVVDWLPDPVAGVPRRSTTDLAAVLRRPGHAPSRTCGTVGIPNREGLLDPDATLLARRPPFDREWLVQQPWTRARSRETSGAGSPRPAASACSSSGRAARALEAARP